MMHVCPENYDPTHSWDECPSKYELGHKKELAVVEKKKKPSNAKMSRNKKMRNVQTCKRSKRPNA
jgi:hypothetical protein